MNLPIRLAAIAAVLHITPAVVLVKRPDAVQALLPGADAYFAREVHLSTPDVHRLHKAVDWSPERSEEHTSELQSPCNLVCRLLLEKKKTKTKSATTEPTRLPGLSH